MIKQFEKSYSVRDKQDVLAMCALQFAAQVEQKNINKDQVDQHVVDKLNMLNNILEPYTVSS